MRFPRQSVIFRGPLDPVPLVGVLFLLVIFILMGSLLYTPGVLLKFETASEPGPNTITVTSGGDIIFAGKTNKATELEQLRNDLKSAPRDQPTRLQLEPGANPKLVEQVQGLFQVQLPTNDLANLSGTDNPTVIVAVNFRGQCFFENRPVQEKELKTELQQRMQEEARGSKKLTMVLLADKAAQNEVVMRLCQLARTVGISEVLLAERPNPFSAPSGRSLP